MPDNLQEFPLGDGPLSVEAAAQVNELYKSTSGEEHWELSSEGNLKRWVGYSPDVSKLSERLVQIAIKDCQFVCIPEWRD